MNEQNRKQRTFYSLNAGTGENIFDLEPFRHFLQTSFSGDFK
jgi:hypothetical protein